MNRTTNFNRLNDNGLNEMRIANPAIKQRRIANPSQRTQRTSLLRQLAVLAVMLILGGTATGQSVIMNGNYFLTHNEAGTEVNTTATTTFNPATCLWVFAQDNYIRTANSAGQAITSTNNNYLQYTSVTLGTEGFNWYRARNDTKVYHRTGNQWNRTYYYLRLNGTTWQISSTDNNNGYLYAVTISAITANVTNPTISGADVLTATGASDYSAPGASYRTGYTNYYFNGADHYCDAAGNSITPANATIGAATWSLTDNAYATVNESTGAVTVNSLPTSDIELTLTVTYPVTAGTGTPAAPSGVTLTASKTITLQGTIPSAPTISVSGTTVTMSTDAPGSTTIRYTLDGSNPTTSSTAYIGPIDVSGQTTSPVVIKAITVRNGNASSVTEQSVQLTLPAPVITADASAGTATISCANAGATIYYTTDGTTPSATNGTEYTGQLSGLPLMTNLQAIAVRDGWNDSPVTSAILTLPSGTDGTTVTLFDYEPHSWSYYSDADCPIRSLNPADVKITYYGDGIMMMNNNNYTASSVENTDYITSSGTNYTGGAKVNVGGENENTFIYYKTLERGDATETAWTYSSSNQSSAASRCPYTPIPNPFQVRPTYGSRGTTNANSFTGWRGFQCWRLKSVSGGAVYSAASGGTALTVGAVINAETEIYFAPNAETGMTVDFEAVWARAYVVMGNSGNANNIPSYNVGAERNFLTLTAAQNYRFDGTSGRYIGNKGYAATISNYYPNGETGNANATISGYNNMTLGADTKFENVTFNSMGSYTLTAAGHDLIIGRGCTGTINYVRGVNGDTENPNYTLRIESCTINYVSFLKGYWTGSNTYTDQSNSMTGNVDLRCVLGCDYDRATNEGITNNLTINNNVILGANNTIDNVNKHRETTNLTIKSGKIGANININANNSYMADAYQSVYMSVSNSQQTIGRRNVVIEGGEVIGIAGGIDAHYLGTGVTNNNVTGIPTPHTEDPSFTVRMKGGKVRGSVYGGAAKSPASGNRRMIFTGGTINGWVGCGCNGTEDDGGKTYGESFLYFGGNTRCEADPAHDYQMNGTQGGYVFGAGKGYAGGTGTSGEMTFGTNVAIADNSFVQRNVYGGGNYGYALESTNVYVCGGTVNGNIFGGSNLKNGPVVNVKMIDGIIKGGLYGGSNETGTITGDVTIQVDGGTVGQGNVGNGIFGGGYGQPTRVNGNVSVTLGTCTTGDVTVYGDVYGGSALGTVNDASSDKTTVSLYNGTIRGGIYGGGYGPGGVAANVNGAVEVKVFGGSVLCSESDPQGEAGSGSVFGCNNAGGAPQSTVKVDIYKTDAAPGEGQYALHAVYGGGNKANYSGTPVVTIHGCNSSIEYVYGGGNASDVRGTNVTIWGGTIGNAFGGGNGYSVTGNHTNQGAAHYNPGANITTEGTNLKIYGGTIGAAFGGSNQYGTINDGVQVTVDSRAESNTGRPACVDPYEACQLRIGELYSGGNEAALISSRNPLEYITPNKISVSLSCSANIGMLFGGAKAANYVGDITLVVDGGTYTKVFGGNNKGGTITGNVTVTFNGGSAEEVYGGCNESGDITGNITVNIDSTNSTCPTRFYVENVYGGGNLAAYDGSPVVNIINGTVQENVYGGGYGSTAEVAGSPAVTVGVSNTEKRALVLGNVFGGGNAAPVDGDTEVKILYNSYIKGNVYGGGNKATVSGDTKVNIGN